MAARTTDDDDNGEWGGMHLDLLGAMRIRRFGADVDMPASKPRLILAMLGLYAGTLVQTNQLIDELWGERPPASAARTVQTYVYHVRKLLGVGDNRAADDPARTVLLTRPGGYVLRLGSSSVVDTTRFDALLNRGRDEIAQNRPADAVVTLREALGLWRGQPFADLRTGEVLSVARVRLEQSRRSALELRIDTEFRLGRHQALVDELHGLVLTEPTHEGFSARLMMALQAGGRRAEALAVYHRLRLHLREELGVAPSAVVRRLFQELLDDEDGPADGPRPTVVPLGHAGPPGTIGSSQTTGRVDLVHPGGRVDLVHPGGRVDLAHPGGRVDPAHPGGRVDLAHPGGRVVPVGPRALPARPELRGREEELRRLRRALSLPASALPRLTTVEIGGGPGIGTSSFAAYAVHDLGPAFRDGAVFVDLAGLVDDGTDSIQLLSERLVAAGVEMPAATHLDEVAGRFREWSRSRRLLLVVDHVPCPRVLAALRPAGPGSAMVVVNRFGAPGQVGDELLELGPLGHGAMIDILVGVVGAERVRREPAVVRRLTELCEGNPLVLRAVARWLACRPTLSATRLIRQVEADPGRLTRLWSAGRTIEDSVRDRISRLSSDAAEVLGAVTSGALRPDRDAAAFPPHPAATEVTCHALARSLRWQHARLDMALDELSDAHLVEELSRVEPAGSPGDALGRPRNAGHTGEATAGCTARLFRVRRIVGLSVAHVGAAVRPPTGSSVPLDSRSIAV